MNEAPLTVYALSEDAARDAHAVIASLVRASLRLLHPGARLDRARFEPDEPGHAAVKANRWKSNARADQRHRVDLLRTLATNLSRSDCLVVFHFDGDTPWAERERSENVRKFHDELVLGVRRVLRECGLEPERVERALRRLVAFVPHYTLESWLYQNTAAAIALCQQRRAPNDVAVFDAWARDRPSSTRSSSRGSSSRSARATTPRSRPRSPRPRCTRWGSPSRRPSNACASTGS